MPYISLNIFYFILLFVEDLKLYRSYFGGLILLVILLFLYCFDLYRNSMAFLVSGLFARAIRLWICREYLLFDNDDDLQFFDLYRLWHFWYLTFSLEIRLWIFREYFLFDDHHWWWWLLLLRIFFFIYISYFHRHDEDDY